MRSDRSQLMSVTGTPYEVPGSESARIRQPLLGEDAACLRTSSGGRLRECVEERLAKLLRSGPRPSGPDPYSQQRTGRTDFQLDGVGLDRGTDPGELPLCPAHRSDLRREP